MIERYNLQKMVDNEDTLFTHIFLEADNDLLLVAIENNGNYNPKDVEVEVKLNGVSVRVANFEALMLDFVGRLFEQRKQEIIGITQEDIDALVKEKLQSLIEQI